MGFLLNNAANSFRWRIATAEADLATGSLANYGLPAPEAANPRDHSAQVPQSDGGQALHGYHSTTFFWDVLSEAQATTLIDLIRDARSDTGFLYMTIWTGAGYDGDPRWIDVQGKPHLPEEAAARNIQSVRGQLIHEAVSFLLNNMTVVNDPSSYTTP